MKNYVICTDSGCDIRSSLLKEWGVENISMTFEFDGEDKILTDSDISPKDFYDKMREGGVARTAAINPETFKTTFAELVKAGNDVLYVGFSSGLSTTFNSSRLAAEEVCEEYPDAKVIPVDTVSASAGQGLLVYFAAQKKASGATIEETAAYISDMAHNICHFFTVDDLEYLKRGGRISSAAAVVGSVLSIKPIIVVDNDGKLVSTGKVRGRKAAINTIVQRYEQYAEEKDGTAFICHSESLAEAEELKETLQQKFGAKVELITDMGPIIGAHVGPGTIGLVFKGNKRD